MAQRWSSKSAASAFAHGIFYFFIRCGGRWLAYLLLYFVVAWYTLITEHGRRGRYYIERRFPGSGCLSRLWHRWRLNLSFGKVLVDRATAGITGAMDMVGAQQNVKALNRLLGEGKGALILSAHVGCWQMAMSALETVKAPKYIVYRRPTEDVDKLAHEHGNSATTVSFIDPGGPSGGIPEIMIALQHGAIVCMTGDRLFGSNRIAISVPFLGGTINVPGSMYRIAAATGAPVVIMFFPRLGDGKFKALTMDIFNVEDRGRDLQNYRTEAERFAKALEKFCGEYRYQFFNFYDIWE